MTFWHARVGERKQRYPWKLNATKTWCMYVFIIWIVFLCWLLVYGGNEMMMMAVVVDVVVIMKMYLVASTIGHSIVCTLFPFFYACRLSSNTKSSKMACHCTNNGSQTCTKCCISRSNASCNVGCNDDEEEDSLLFNNESYQASAVVGKLCGILIWDKRCKAHPW